MTRPIPGGFLVAIEGIDGSGKTTQAQMLADFCLEKRLDYSVSKEPTRGQFGQILRDSALTGRLTVEEELDLFLKDRAEHVEKLIRPALDQGKVVILDRYYYSTAAYQGARGADPVAIVKQNEEFAPKPDLLILLDVPPAIGLERIRQRGDVPNAFETEDSLEHARQIFNAIDSPALYRLDAKTGPDILQFHIQKRFIVDAMNKISASDLSPSGLNRTLQFFGDDPLPIESPSVKRCAEGL
jgi:dTMP kinase